MILRLLATISTITGWYFWNVYQNATATINSGAAAVDQFSNSATDNANSFVQMAWYNVMSGGVPLTIIIGVILMIWYKPLKQLFANPDKFLTILGVLLVGNAIIPTDAWAYYSRQDWAEVYNVLPNHSAFMIPATGNTKDTQKQFESESFLNEKKVGAKRIEIPHVKLKNSGAIDYYVPGAILVLLDRTPYVVTWTKVKTTGSEGNQEMCVESQDSVELCFDTSIGANVLEEDAAKYLYWFGTEPVNGNSEDERKFPSVLSGKSLQNVMNTRVFSRIHAAYFAEFSKYTFDEMLKQKATILNKVEKDMITEYKKMGITIEYVGVASQFRYADEIQKGINTLTAQAYLQKAASAKMEAAKVDRYIAETQIMINKSLPYTKWDGKTFPNMPSVMVGMDNVVTWFKELVTSK